MYRKSVGAFDPSQQAALDPQRHPDDLRRNAKAQRNFAAAQSSGHDHVAAALDDVAIGEPAAIRRRRPYRFDEWQADLAAMRVTGDRQRNALRHLRKNIGLVREQDDGIVTVDACKRTRQVVDAAEASRSQTVCKLVVEAGKPETLILGIDPDDIILQ